jgi:hypothetical protein
VGLGAARCDCLTSKEKKRVNQSGFTFELILAIGL